MIRGLGRDCLDSSAIPPRMPDVDVLRMAANDGRVVVTADKDFGELVFVHAIACPGVVLIRVALSDESDRVTHVKSVWPASGVGSAARIVCDCHRVGRSRPANAVNGSPVWPNYRPTLRSNATHGLVAHATELGWASSGDRGGLRAGASGLGGADALHVELAPVAEGAEGALEGEAVVGEGVFDLRGDGGVDGAGDDAVGLELAEVLGEHLLGDAGDLAAQLGEAVGALVEPPEDQGFPLAAEDVEGGFDGAVVRLGGVALDHGFGVRLTTIFRVGTLLHDAYLLGGKQGPTIAFVSQPERRRP
jgi:hypothetical protein